MSEHDTAPAAGRRPLIAAFVLFLAFIANIVVGKVGVMMGATEAPGIGDVGEFLVLFAAVVLFIAACLARERQANPKQEAETPPLTGDTL